MARVGILCGLKSESELLAPLSGGDDAPYVRLSGARAAIARDAARELANLPVDGLVSFGIAGGLDPALGPGDLVVGTDVVAPDGRHFPTDRFWYEHLASLIGKVAGVREARIAGVDGVAGKGAKARLFAVTGAGCVDMESHAIARAAAEAGKPFAVLRAVADPAGADLPAWLGDSVRPDGSISLLPILAGAAVQPWEWGSLWMLGAYSSKARQGLGGAVGTLGPGFGLLSR